MPFFRPKSECHTCQNGWNLLNDNQKVAGKLAYLGEKHQFCTAFCEKSVDFHRPMAQ